MSSEIKAFLNENFLLDNRVAQLLYHDYAADLPIIDYHNHLPPNEIAQDRMYDNVTQIWLEGDHYKWRAMRTFGVDEEYITGKAGDQEKFHKWAETVPYTIRNPLFHWTHIELRRYFGIEELLNKENADIIYHQCSELLKGKEFSTRNLLQKMNVELLCTTDDPVDSLEFHKQYSINPSKFKMLPAFRPDRAILINQSSFPAYIEELSRVSNLEIRNVLELIEALKIRVEYFHENGCRLADHGLEYMYSNKVELSEADKTLKKRLKGESISNKEAESYSATILFELAKTYTEKGWVQQFHLGAMRNNNTRLLQKLGPDTGFDSIGDWNQAINLSRFLDMLDSVKKLTKTIIYNLNPRDNALMASMIGNFNDGSSKGKIQFGSAWWFLDQKKGMEDQLNALSNMGLLSCFIGMLTDSRSFLSFPRHEYFRRILCNLIGRDVHNGELPNDIEWLGKIVQDICYYNAKSYFNF